MGGNAIKNVVRLEAKEYQLLCKEVESILSTILNTNVSVIKAYRTKETFGDMDIIVPTDSNKNYEDIIIKHFDLAEEDYHKNGKVFSFRYKNFQVDLIKQDSDKIEFGHFYFDYNDLGNILGRLTHKLGIKLGHDGLWLIVKDSNRVLEEILLTTDYRDVLNILELDIYTYDEGFDTLNDMFEYVSKSKYFNPDIYLLDNRNSTSRVRDAKRKTYHDFLNWCGINRDTFNKFPFSDITEHGGYNIREPYYTDIICKKWPNIKKIVDDKITQYKLDLEFKSVYNARVIMELVDIEGKELGEFKKIVDELMDCIDRKYFIENPEILKNLIENEYMLYRIDKKMKEVYD